MKEFPNYKGKWVRLNSKWRRGSLAWQQIYLQDGTWFHPRYHLGLVEEQTGEKLRICFLADAQSVIIDDATIDMIESEKA